ncbi:MAG: TolC family outer membrane protein [Pseudomonadales bacterium]
MTRQIVSIRAIILISSIISLNAAAQSLTDTIRTTLRTNPQIQASKFELEAAEHSERRARADFLPSIDLVFASGRETSNNSTTRAAGVDDRTLSREEKSVRLTQLLFDGGATGNLVDQRQAQVDAAMARLVNSQERVGLRAVEVYLEVLRRDAVVTLAEENLRHHNNTLAKIQERFDSGVGTKVDVVQTQGRQAQSRSNLILSERDAENGRAEFFRVVGEHPGQLDDPQSAGRLPETLDEALQIAYANNPRLQSVRSELEAAEASHRQAKGAFLPKFDLVVGATRNRNIDGILDDNDDESAVVRMTYNLYRGGADRARLNEVEAREFTARERARDVRRAVREDVTLIWNELQDITARLQYLELHVNSTEEVLSVYNEQLSLGKRTLLDVLDIQNELLRAKVAYISGQYTEKLARYRVLASMGQLLDAVGVSPEQ